MRPQLALAAGLRHGRLSRKTVSAPKPQWRERRAAGLPMGTAPDAWATPRSADCERVTFITLKTIWGGVQERARENGHLGAGGRISAVPHPFFISGARLLRGAN